MSEDIQTQKWSDIRRVIESVVCSWMLSGHTQSLHMTLPAGPLYSRIDGARLGQLVSEQLDCACRSANRFATILLEVERLDNRALFKVEVGCAVMFTTTFELNAFDTGVASRPARHTVPGSRVRGIAAIGSARA